jgi:PKD repeat protein
VTPTTGLAPLNTDFSVIASEPNGNAVTYSIAFGDGTSTSGTITAPYNAIDVPHTYGSPGVYDAHVSVSNGGGGFSQKTLTITATAPANHAPLASLTMSATSGVVPFDTTATLNASDPDGDALTYSLDFGDGSSVQKGSLPASPIAHEYTQAGSYTIRLGVSDGEQTTVRTTNIDVGLSEPLSAAAGDDVQGVVGQQFSLDGSASRPLIGIDSYTWNFGDGSPTVSGSQVKHAFSQPGTYTVSLTVKSGGTTSTDTLIANVSPIPQTPAVRVTVTDSGSSPIAGADVLVIDGAGTRYSSTSDDAGSATLNALPDGVFTVYAWHDGYQPNTASVNVSNGSGNVTVALQSGAIAQTSLTAQPLTEQQIVAAGINPNDPANENVFQFEVHLAFATQDLTFSGYTSSGDGGFFIDPVFSSPCPDGQTCGKVDGYSAYPTVKYVNSQPSIVWMVIPAAAKWLKEFFDVHLVVSNLASSAFTLQNGHVSLSQLPTGLSLAPTAVPQSLEQGIGDIPGGTSQQADWIVRGDAEGYYTLTANYTGTLEPFGVSVSIPASTPTNALHVWGGSAVHMIVDADDHAIAGNPYRVRVGLQNVADVPVYNPQVELLQQGRVNYIYQPLERLAQGTDVIEPGTTFWTDYYRLVPEVTGTLDLSDSFVKKTAGNVDVASTIESHPSVDDVPNFSIIGFANKLGLQWDAVPGATEYRVFRTPDPDTAFTATPETVRFIAPTQAVVDGASSDDTGWYAVSAFVDGKWTMFHPLRQVGEREGSPIVATIDDRNGDACQQDLPVKVTASTFFFNLDHYSISVNGQDRQLTIDDHSEQSATFETTVDFFEVGNGIDVSVAVTDSDGDTRTFTSSITNACRTRKAVVLAAGLASSFTLDLGDKADPNDGWHQDWSDSVIPSLERAGYNAGASPNSPDRTILEFDYRGGTHPAIYAAGPAGDGHAYFVPGTYSSKDTIGELVELGQHSSSTADEFLNSLLQYRYAWWQAKGEVLQFDVLGHSEGGYEAVALARRAVDRNISDLFRNVISIDGAIHPDVVIPEISPKNCFGLDTTLLSDAAWATDWKGQLVLTAGKYVAREAEKAFVAHQIDAIEKFGIDVTTITNKRDGCLSPDATITTSGLATTAMFDVSVPGNDGTQTHGALLHNDPTYGGDHFPLQSYLDNDVGLANAFSMIDKPLDLVVDGVVAGVPPSVSLSARSTNVAMAREASIFTPSSRSAVLDAQVSSGHRLDVHVSSSGTPEPDSGAALLDETGGLVDRETADANGVISFIDVPPGQYSLHVEGITSGRSEADLSMPNDDLSTDVDLQPAAAVTVHVTSANGSPLSIVAVNILLGESVIASRFTNAQGDAAFGALAPGDYSAQVIDPLQRTDKINTAPVTAVASEDTTVALHLDDVGPPNELPTAAFTSTPSSGDAPLDVGFDATSSTDSDGSIETYNWVFGDGDVGTGVTARHTYDAPGTYMVLLTITDNAGGQATVQGEIDVTGPGGSTTTTTTTAEPTTSTSTTSTSTTSTSTTSTSTTSTTMVPTSTSTTSTTTWRSTTTTNPCKPGTGKGDKNHCHGSSCADGRAICQLISATRGGGGGAPLVLLLSLLGAAGMLFLRRRRRQR